MAFIEIISGIIASLESKNVDTISSGLDSLDGILDKLVRQTAGPTVNTKASKIIYSAPMVELLDSQDNFSLNITSRLISVIGWLRQQMRKHEKENSLEEELLIRTLEHTQALCLIHHESRECFELTSTMSSILDLLNICHNSELQIAALNTLVASMVHQPKNIRVFEQLEGPKLVCVLFKKKDTPKDVKLKILEFLFFYLIPETQARTPYRGRKTTAMKEKVLSKYLSNAKGLVNELETSKPFGDIAVEW